MLRKLLAISFCLGISASLSAQPYGWLMGSTADTPKTGDKIVIVDLGNGTTVSPAAGWQYTNHSAGADPTAPSFNPDGSVAYVIVGGDGNASQPTGYLYLFDTDNVITSLSNSQTPNAPFQTISYPSSDTDAVEPVGITVADQGDRVYVVDGKEQHLFVYDVLPDRTLNQVTVMDTGSGPGPLWITQSGDKGYFVNFEDFVVKAVDLRSNPPAITQTINVPPPAQSNGASQPGTYCSFSYPRETSMTLLPPPGLGPADTSKLRIYSGYYGFQTILFGTPQTVNDKFRVYSLDTATNTLDNSGNPILDFTPAGGQITFPPTLLSFDDSSGNTYTHVSGSVVIKPNGSADSLTFPANNIMPIFGLQPEAGDSFFIGTIPAADAVALVSGNYVPVRNTSMLLRYADPSAPPRATVAATNVHDVDRNMTIPLGFHDGKVVLGATDAYGLKGLPVPLGTLRDTKIVLYDPVSDTATEILTQIVGGAYAEQPLAGYDPTDSDGDGFTDQVEKQLGSSPSDPSSVPDFGDFTNDGKTNSEDALALYRAIKANGGTLPYDAALDANLDGILDLNDAILLYAWTIKMSNVIPAP